MTTLAHQHRSRARRNHLTLVPTVDVVEPTVVCVTPDPEPGPHDAAELVERYSPLLPADLDCDGVVTL
jgi:hypothetical protein